MIKWQVRIVGLTEEKEETTAEITVYAAYERLAIIEAASFDEAQITDLNWSDGYPITLFSYEVLKIVGGLNGKDS